MSKKSLEAWHDFAKYIYVNNRKAITPAQFRVIQVMSVLCLDEYIYNGGNLLLAINLNVSKRQVSTLLGQVSNLRLIELKQSQEWHNRNQVWEVTCLKDFAEGRTPLLLNRGLQENSEALRIEVSRALSRSSTSKEKKSASVMNSENVKDEKQRLYFSKVIELAPDYLKHITYGSKQLEVVCDELMQKYSPEEVVSYLNTLNLGNVKKEALFSKFLAGLKDLAVKEPRSNVEGEEKRSSNQFENSESAPFEEASYSPEAMARRRELAGMPKRKEKE